MDLQLTNKYTLRNKILINALLIISLSFISCNKNEDTDDEFIYPLSIGNNWEYSREWNLLFYSDTISVSPEYEDTVTVTSNISVAITGKVLLNDTLETTEMTTSENESVNMYTGKYYYRNDEDGLYIYAYKSAGSIIYPKKQAETTILFKGMEFDNYRQLSTFIQQLTPNYRILSDSLNFEKPPVKTLQYPLVVGNQWTYREDYNPWRIDKKVMGRKKVELNIGRFDCYEVRFLYDFDHNGEWDDDISITDFISKEGLIQRSTSVSGMKEATQDGLTGRWFDSVETFVLTESNVESF